MWIKPEDTATPAALSNNFSFSHTPLLTGRGGGTGLLISNDRKCIPLPSLGISFPVAQIVEHGTSNAKIMGSIPRESKS